MTYMAACLLAENQQYVASSYENDRHKSCLLLLQWTHGWKKIPLLENTKKEISLYY